MLLRDVPGYCLYFTPYTFFCGWITPDGCISPNPSSVWLAGGVAGKHLFFPQHWQDKDRKLPRGGAGAATSSRSPREDMGLNDLPPPGPGPLAPRLRFMT